MCSACDQHCEWLVLMAKGKPSKGTPKDKRLKANKGKRKK